MAILNLTFISNVFQLTKIVNLVSINKILGSINVVKTTEVIFMTKQNKKETFLNNLVKTMNNICALIVYQA